MFRQADARVLHVYLNNLIEFKGILSRVTQKHKLMGVFNAFIFDNTVLLNETKYKNSFINCQRFPADKIPLVLS